MEGVSKQMLILKAIVDSYIATGEPVASKTICDMLDYRVSSATVRNYMAQLMKLGYIVQPHTSAGRIPSDKGYLEYIDAFVSDEPTQDIKDNIDNALLECDNEPDGVLKAVVELLSHMLHGYAFAITPDSKDARIYAVRFVKIGRYTAMAVLVTTSGVVKTGLFRCEYVITDEIINIFEKLIGDRFTGIMIREINSAFLQSTAVSMGELGMLMSNVLWTVGRLCGSAEEITLFSSENAARAFKNSDYESAQRLGFLLSDKKRLTRLAGEYDNGVYFGGLTDIRELEGFALISQRYTASDTSSGVLSIICSTRTDYLSAVPAVKYAAQEAGKMIKAIAGSDE